MSRSSYFYRSARCSCGFRLTVAGYSLARVQFRLDERCLRCGKRLKLCKTPPQVEARFTLDDTPGAQAKGYKEGAHRSGKNKQEERGAKVMEMFDEDYLSLCD